jgi:HPt (histidine-containing phosphotransfer) domain-containing protein
VTWQQIGREFDALRIEYRKSLPAKLDRIEALWDLILKGMQDDTRLEQLKKELHTIAGSAGTFGLPQVGLAARTAEDCLGEAADAAGLNESQRREFARLLGDLKNTAQAPH